MLASLPSKSADCMLASLVRIFEKHCCRKEQKMMVMMLEHVGGFVDGVLVKVVGEETFRLCRELVDRVVLVSRDAICALLRCVGSMNITEFKYRYDSRREDALVFYRQVRCSLDIRSRKTISRFLIQK
ncbi:hypothetical protein BHE74_00036851 [Ensete ventricosum]|nr:hypothetical protein GW17_00049173 [Ensete ventricosum]RWW56433.1 hypothetical protein BHE74_00036851 [Ensete ventricosum]